MNPLTIAVDVDEVLAQLSAEVLKRYNYDYGDCLTPEDLTGWVYTDFVKPECGSKIYDYFRQPGIYDCIEPYEGGLEAVEFLRKKGHRVIFATSCPRGSCDMKAEWLCEHGFLPKHLRVLKDFAPCSDKSLIRADVLVDDAVHNLESFPKWKVLVTRPHNREMGPTKPHWRVEGMLTAAYMIDAYLKHDFGYWDVPASYCGSPEGVTTI